MIYILWFILTVAGTCFLSSLFKDGNTKIALMKPDLTGKDMNYEGRQKLLDKIKAE